MRKRKLRTPTTRKPRKPRTPGSAEQKSRLIKFVTDLKKKTPCGDCGSHFPPEAMDLDHLPGYKKKFTISQFLRESGHLPEAERLLLEELKKVQVVCANCHRVRTVRRARRSAGRGFPFRR